MFGLALFTVTNSMAQILPLARHLFSGRCRWVDNIKMNLREIGWGSMDWVHLAQHRGQWKALVNTTRNIRVA
jgi:hypothetical protein